MKDIPKTKPKRRSLVWRLCRWLFLVIGAVTVFQSGYFLLMWLAFNNGIAFPSLGEKVAFALVNLIAVVFLGWLLHRPFCRVVVRLVRKPDGQPTLMRRALSRVLNKRMVPRYLFCLACLTTLLAVFYAVENWRGKRAWENCRRELEAKGEVLDWNAYIPAPVPDEQNIFKAPKIAEWFVKGSMAAAVSGEPSKSRDTNAPFSVVPPRDVYDGRVVVAEVTIVSPNGPLPAGKAAAVFRLDDLAAREEAAKLLRESIGPCAEGAQYCVLVARSMDQTIPVHLVVQADTVPSTKTLADFLSLSPEPNNGGTTLGLSHVQVTTAGSNRFRLLLTASVYTAADYLARSQPAVPDLDVLRKALERPFARMDGDYQRPFEQPIPNFVRLRTVAQLLSQRAQCYLLLGQPEAAWHELALVRDICRLLEGKPTSNSAMLVQAMIDVAITGLYTRIIEDGLRLQVWREPELAAMQKQLTNINLLPLVRASVNTERAGVCRTFEITPPAEFCKWFGLGGAEPGLWETLKNPTFLFMRFAPRGWIYQNMCAVALLDQHVTELFDLPKNQILPHKADGINNQIETACSHFTPYTFLAAVATPNFVKAWRTLLGNQTQVNEAFIACGLERYRLAHGQYPETLNALVPQFAEQLPHDIIGGQPLKYHRTADGQFVLYSVGWNEKDDGGVPGRTDTEGDSVWRPAAGP
jgi:hypothetical protein